MTSRTDIQLRASLIFSLTILLTACATLSGVKPQSPEVTIAAVRPLNLSLTNQRLAFSLRVRNPNAFDLPLQTLNFTARFAGQEIATGSSNEHVNIPSNGEAIVEVAVKASIRQMLDQFQAMIDSKTLELDYGVVGTVKLANWPRKIPFNVEGEFDNPAQ